MKSQSSSIEQIVHHDDDDEETEIGNGCCFADTINILV